MAVDQQIYSPGSLVRLRERDWVVVSPEEDGVLRLRPVDGSSNEITGVLFDLEKSSISPTEYSSPDPATSGDFTGALLLRDAIRLTLRNGAGPFRSMGALSITPRPYQFVPLIMALRMNPVRMLLSDDVGVGKTIEAAMIARELLDRGVIHRIAVLCPPHLCSQWAKELHEKFGIDTAVIQPSYIPRLEREVPRQDVSIYQYYRHLVVSIDYIKSDKNKTLFLANAPDFIIVDEAHASARPRSDRERSQHQRYAFLKELTANANRHVVLVTATPHSGVEESFRSLLGLLHRDFDKPDTEEISNDELLPYVVQRRRYDLAKWVGGDSPFPERIPEERSYQMSREYTELFEDVVSYFRETVSTGLESHKQRVRYWAAIAILRCILSSPAAAKTVLENRAKNKVKPVVPEETEDEETTRKKMTDSVEDEQPSDYAPSAEVDEAEVLLSGDEKGRLERFLKTAEKLSGPTLDMKLNETTKIVRGLLREGYHPIVYCRFIATAEYVAKQLSGELKSEFLGLQVKSVTGDDGDSEKREEIVSQLVASPLRVLVATECLSEGINLQENFDAVVHYDLPWNPNRLEQREGRVDRYGQKKKFVKTVTLYGSNNQIDLIVLKVLIDKARAIRKRLGVSVPVPEDSDAVIKAIIDSLLLRNWGRGQQLQLALEDPQVSTLHNAMDRAADREDKLRAYFAQKGIKPDEVSRELKELEPVLGTAADIQYFIANGIQRFNGNLKSAGNDVFSLQPGDLRDQVISRAPDNKFPLSVTFRDIPPEDVTRIGRNHPIVTALSEAVIGKAMSGKAPQFARSGAIYTNTVILRTAVLVLRLRYLLEEATQQFAEEVVVTAFRQDGGSIRWLEPLLEQGLTLLQNATVTGNISTTERQMQVKWALDQLNGEWSKEIVSARVKALEEAHKRLRTMVNAAPLKVTPKTPPDILGCYVLVPGGMR